MDIQTILALNEYNRQFYSQQAQSFAQKRRYFWPSWQRFWEMSNRLRETQDPVRVLDVGCGTGRFSLFLDQRGVNMEYIGVDLSSELLADAQEKLLHASFPYHLVQYDVIAGLLSDQTLAEFPSADVIALFGVLHHVPSFALRQKLMANLVEKLPSGGELWLTLWNPQGIGKNTPPAWPWPSELDREPGDELIAWKDSAVPRYVHWVSEAEDQQLFSSLPVEITHQWWETELGERGNHCFLLRKN